MIKNKILLLEINELPLSVVEAYSKDMRFANLQYFLNHSYFVQTLSSDIGDLSPWVTWPTVHRGISGPEHNIKNLGQDHRTFRGVPIWDIYLEKKLNIGIFGSLQSWPPKYPGTKGFYVPDTFSQDPSCFPKFLEPIQKFNLENVQKNQRIISKKNFNLFSSLKSAFELIRHGVTAKTCFKISQQLMLEKLDSRYRMRRPIFQTIILFDVFKKLISKSDIPHFNTFFTNHIAGIMHRYWDKIFIEQSNQFHSNSFHKEKIMDFAITVLDEVLGFAIELKSRNPDLVVLVASSMGQALTKSDEHDGMEALLTNLDTLMTFLKIDSNSYKELMAMAPQKSIEVRDESLSKLLLSNLEKIQTSSGAKIFSLDRNGESISITTLNPKKKDREANIFFENEKKTWAQIGISFINIEQNSAYHIPEGILYILGKEFIETPISTLETSKIKNFLLDISFGNQL